MMPSDTKLRSNYNFFQVTVSHPCLVGLALLFLSAAGTLTLWAADDPVRGKSALPGGPCQTQGLPSWTEQEKWVWNQICVGKVANFNEGPGYRGKLDPKAEKGWPRNRVLRPEFLETILLHEPFKNALPRQGLRIVGAWFPASLDLSGATLTHPLALDGSLFEAEVDLSGLRTSHYFSLQGSKFTGKLDMDSLRVDGSLFMRDGAEFADVKLLNAKIGGAVEMDSSKFTGKLDMDSLQVDGSLLMRNGAEFAEVVLLDAKIGDTLEMDKSKFGGKLDMDNLRVGSYLFMRNAEFAEVELLNAKIGGAVEMERSKFTGKLDMDSLQVERSLFMRDAIVSAPVPVSLIFAKIGGDLYLSGSTFSSLDLTATRVNGEFQLGQKNNPAKWLQGGKLTLLNTEVGVLQDLQDAWPDELELNGFTYGRLGGFAADRKNDMVRRDVTWLKDKWLEKQKSYSPQPYDQLASVLEKEGYESKARAIRYASRAREHSETTDARSWIKLTLLWMFIGYGYYNFVALIWIIAFIIAGVFALRISGQGKAHGMPYGITYSFDMLLPIIKLRERHYEIDLAGWVRYYFYFHKVMGYVLASFLIAGLSGLTK